MVDYYLGNRAQSEDRFRSSTLSLNNAAGDTTSSSSSHSYLPSYAAHTSSSMSKLREGTPSSTPPLPVPILVPSTSTASLTMNSQTRRVPSVVSLDTRSISSTKNMTKSRSTQNLVLPTTTTQQSKITTLRRVKISRLPRRPPNLPTATSIQSSTSSSASSNTSSPTKTNQTKENAETKQYLHSSSLQESVLPLRQLDNTTNDLMPKWAQDCFYRTVVLGLKPLRLQDIPSSPNKPPKRSSSTCSVESSDSLETTNELQACTLNDNDNSNEIKVRRSISIPDYRHIKQAHQVLQPSLSETTMNDTKDE
jgi:hypothetical protein